MTACQTLAQSLSATPLATSYPTTLFSLPPHTTTKSLTYRPTLSIFSLYDKVLRRPVELAANSGQTHRSKQHLYPITSSAMESSPNGASLQSFSAALAKVNRRTLHASRRHTVGRGLFEQPVTSAIRLSRDPRQSAGRLLPS